MEHAGRGEEDHRLVGLDRLRLEFLDVLKVEHVVLNEGFADFLIRPVDEQLVVEVRLLCQAAGEVDRVLQIGAVPVGLQQDAELSATYPALYLPIDLRPV